MPFTADGCTLFVKLRHLDPRDSQRVVIDSRHTPWHQGMVEGVFSDEHGDYPAGSWLRMSQHQPFSREGCLILVKTGHLV